MLELEGFMKSNNNSIKNTAKKANNIVRDSVITTAIKTKLLADPDIKGLEVHVKTTKGIVTLKGVLPTSAMKKRVISIVNNTEGVVDVNSEITVHAAP